MTDEQPSVQAKMKALQAANRQLIAAEKRATRSRAMYAVAESNLVTARLAVRRMLEALQPELPATGELPPAISSDDCVRR